MTKITLSSLFQETTALCLFGDIIYDVVRNTMFTDDNYENAFKIFFSYMPL